MRRRTTRISRWLGVAWVATTLSACAGATGQATAGAPPAPAGAPVGAAPAAARRIANPADVNFVAGMIPHHAQAVKIAGWALTHGARDDIKRFAERIVVAQRDEIELMQNWLREKGEPVPPADATHHRMTHGGTQHDMLMPGMLTDEELKRLDAARGTEFDRLYLQAMIKHHEGAIQMVDELEAAHGSRQDEFVFRLSQDVYADQTTEIEFMKKLLATIK